MAESPVHKERVFSMVEWMRQEGVAVTHASGGLPLPDPYKIERHEPDAIGTKEGVTWIGEAKTGDDLVDVTSQEQFDDFSQMKMSGTDIACPFVLCVPNGHGQAAEQAVREAGGSTSNLIVIS